MTPPGMLEGLRVLDLSRIIAGPYCAMLLGDLGADVVKLERPGRGDDLRSLRGGTGMSAIFAAVNRNKRGIAVDLREWTRFCQGLGDPELADHPKFAVNPDRLANHAEFKERVEGRLATATTAEWVTRFEAVSIAAGPIYEFDEVFADPQARHLGLLTELEQPGHGRLRMLDFPFQASATPARIARPAPLLGQHTREVLEELGLPTEDIERLVAAGAIQLGPAG